MNVDLLTEALRQGVGVAIRLGGPMLILSMLVGVIMAIFQAVTQIHEQTLSFILKLLVVVSVCMVGGGWMLQTLVEYTENLFVLMRSL